MRFIKNPELKGILAILLIALVLGVLLAGFSGKLEQWGLPWFTGGKIVDKIVFVSNRSGTNEIYVMNLDGSDQRQLTENAKALCAPAISSAGNRVIFVGMVGSVSQILGVGSEGGTPYALSSSTGSKRQPGFSPDGKKLSYIESGRVWVAEINGSNPKPVLPTHEEMAAAMQDSMNRGQIPMYSSYTWGPDSVAMAGVSSQDRVSDALTYLSKPGEEIQTLTPANAMFKVTGLRYAFNAPIMAAALLKPGNKPEGWLVAFDSDNEQFKPLMQAQSVEFGDLAVSPDGSDVVVPIVSSEGKPPPGLLKVGVESGKSKMVCNGLFENLVYSADGSVILATKIDAETKKRSVVSIDPGSGKLTVLASEGDCFDAVFSPASK